MNKLTVLRCIYLFLFLFSFLNALKGQLHIAQGRVTERQRSDGTLGICMVHTIQRPVRATENYSSCQLLINSSEFLFSCPYRALVTFATCLYPGRCPGLDLAAPSGRTCLRASYYPQGDALGWI